MFNWLASGLAAKLLPTRPISSALNKFQALGVTPNQRLPAEVIVTLVAPAV